MPVSIQASHTTPPYPVEAQRRGESGTTEMLVTLGADGAPVGVEITRSSGSPRLDEAAVAHIQKVWRWEPTKTSCRAAVRIVWAIQEPEAHIMDAAAILNPPLAEYPTEAQKLDRQTVVGVVASIAPDGSLLEVRLFQSSGIPALDDRTLEFVRRRYSWTPAQISGRPVRSEIRLVVRWFPEGAR
jgi:TonB family protein